MTDAGPSQRARENASGIAALLVTGTWIAAMLAGFEYWLPLMLFGYIVIVPLVGILFEDDEDESETDESTAEAERGSDVCEDDALATLRDRYARGELTDEQFERKVERLLEIETLEDVEDGTRGRDRDRERDRTSEVE